MSDTDEDRVTEVGSIATPKYRSQLMQEMTHIAEANGFDPYGDLTNAVHPLFARENFAPTMNYDSLLPTLRLVTRLLDTPQVRHFLYTLWFGTRQDSGMATKHGEQIDVVTSDKQVLTLTRDDQAEVRHGLAELARMLRFEPLSDGASIESEAKGQCDWDRERNDTMRDPFHPGPSIRQHRVLRGSCAIIRIEERRLKRVARRVRPQDDPCWFLRARFELVLIILHELGHAAEMAHSLVIDAPEPFVENALVTELGYELVQRLFGVIELRTSHWRTWPDRTHVKQYPYKIYMRGTTDDVLPESCFTMKKDNFFVCSLFYERFWERARVAGPTAVVPDSVVAWLYHCRGAGKKAEISTTVCDLFGLAMPGNYVLVADDEVIVNELRKLRDGEKVEE